MEEQSDGMLLTADFEGEPFLLRADAQDGKLV